MTKLVVYLTRCMFDWINSASHQNEKYSTIFKMHNYGLLVNAFRTLDGEHLTSFATTASEDFKLAMEQYIDWNVTNSFPALAAVAKRIEGAGSRVKQEELALYVRR